MILRYGSCGNEIEIDLDRGGDGWVATTGGATHEVAALDLGPGLICVTIDGTAHRARVVADGNTRWIWIEGRTWKLDVPDPGADRRDVGEADGGGELDAPISGAVVTVDVAPGTSVEEGQVLVVVEAMKMEHRIRSPRSGVVAAVHCEVGAMVDQGMRLVDLEPDGD